jgi:pimeloyl-ACP methyl ester carboxylesterase
LTTVSVEINSYTLDAVRQGAGQPLVLLHGSVSEAGTWQKHIDILSDSYDVIAPSQRYFGKRPWPDNGAEFGSTRHATDLLHLIEALELHDVLCAGWSYGGNIALHASLLNPHVFKKLFLYEPAAASLLTDADQREQATTDRLAMFARTAHLLETSAASAAVEAFLDDAVGRSGAFRELPSYIQKICFNNAETLNLLLTMKPPELSLNTFAVPTMIAYGSNTRDFFQVTANGLGRQQECISVKQLADADHLWPVVNPEDFCEELISAFHG